MVHEVTDQEIDDQLKEMQNRHATERSVERPLEKGDVLIADLQRLDDGAVPIIGEKYEERYFIIGAEDAPSPEFEEATLGMRQGEERRVRFAYRDDLPNQELAGKREFFGVTARDVRERQMPELDDDFAKDVGEQLQTLEDLRAHVAQSMARQWEFMGRQKFRSDLVAELMKQNPFELPDNIVDHYLQTLRESRERDGDGEPGPAAEPADEERQAAVRQLQGHLLIEAVRKQAGLEVSEEELDRYIRERAEERGVEAEDLKRSAQIEDLRRDLADDKVFEFLSEQAKIEDEKV
jgi:trigger factor